MEANPLSSLADFSDQEVFLAPMLQILLDSIETLLRDRKNCSQTHIEGAVHLLLADLTEAPNQAKDGQSLPTSLLNQCIQVGR